MFSSAADHLRPGLFEGRQVLITGGTSGIGAAIGEAFLKLGAAVLATGVTEAEVEAARALPGLAGAGFTTLDVRNGKAVVETVAALPRLDHVVNCAGVIRRNAELDPDVFADVVDINLNGSMRVCAAARPRLAESGGTIVNTASMLAFFGGGLVPGYSASKGGIAQLTKSLAIAYASDGIRVNAIAPGWIATPLTKALREDPARDAAITGRTAMKRWGEPSEIAGGALFLSSPLASFVTGAVLVIDGGYLIT
jgi:NAD(P)-dependent dehydrogenase (short-subunit alcohol dehydrogenase family)